MSYKKKLDNIDLAMGLLHESLIAADSSYEHEIRLASMSDQDEEDRQSDCLDAMVERLSGDEIKGVFNKIMDKIREGEA